MPATLVTVTAARPRRATGIRLLVSLGLVAALAVVSTVKAQPPAAARPPVIDVHVHSTNVTPTQELATMRAADIRYIWLASLATDLGAWAAALDSSQYTPATGFNITVPTPTSEQQWMVIQPAGTLAAGTVTLPLNTGVPDGTQVLITTTQIITSFTLALNGAAAAFGAPTTLAANAFFTMRFYQATNSWYRVA